MASGGKSDRRNAKGHPVGRPFGVMRRAEGYFFLPFFAFLAGFFALADFLAAFLAIVRSSVFQVPVRNGELGRL